MIRTLFLALCSFIVLVAGCMTSPARNGLPTNVSTIRMNGEIPIEAEDVEYFAYSTGYFARPAGSGNYPGVIMVHEWWGLNDEIKEMARKLASEGYAVLAVDLYYGKAAATRDEAQQYRNALKDEEALQNMQSAARLLRNRGSTTLGVLGWCFGGGQALKLAASGEPLDATVIYYGQLLTEPEQLTTIRHPILGIFGEEDTSVSVESVRAFESALREAGISHQIHIYPRVGHAFANPSGPNYAPGPTRDAWEKTMEFLKANTH